MKVTIDKADFIINNATPPEKNAIAKKKHRNNTGFLPSILPARASRARTEW